MIKVSLLSVFFMFSFFITAHTAELTLKDRALAELEYDIKSYKASSASLDAQAQDNVNKVEFYKNLMDITESTFRIQQAMTVCILILVTVIVMGGMYFSYLQFKKDTLSSQDNEGNAAKATFKISREGVEFSSSVIGLIVLFMSFYFFYVYVTEVYKISPYNIPMNDHVNHEAVQNNVKETQQ